MCGEGKVLGEMGEGERLTDTEGEGGEGGDQGERGGGREGGGRWRGERGERILRGPTLSDLLAQLRPSSSKGFYHLPTIH